jgi:hypothetical protein
MKTIQLTDEIVQKLQKFYNMPEYFEDEEESNLIQEICKEIFEK